jgi:large subunit ribosomal protein L18e
MFKTKTKIGKQAERKTNPELFETVIIAKKNAKWLEVASIISSPKRRKIVVNLEQINKEAKEGEIIVVPGKVLSQGEITKKVKVAALGFSENAKEKLLNSKSEVILLKDEIKKNPDAKGIKIIKN